MEETHVLVESSQDDDECDSSGNDDSYSTSSDKSASDDSSYPEQSPSGHYSNSHACKKTRREVDDTQPAIIREAKTNSRRLRESSEVQSKNPSTGRPLSEQEKSGALMAATRAANSTPDSEVVVMRPRHVDRVFRVGMRRSWVAKHVTLEAKKVIFRTKGKDWFVGLYFHKTHKSTELTSGWKKFAIGNKLKEFDACVFAPAGRSEDGILIL